MKSKFLFTAALAAMAFTSCRKDDGGQGSVQPGQDTYIGMTIQLPKSAVSHTFQGDVNATEAESKLTSVIIGVWSDGDNAVTYTDLDVSELNNNNDGSYTATKAVKAKTGTNNIIVLANTLAKPTIVQIKGAAFETTVTDIATNEKFVMYSNAVKVMKNVAFASKEEVERAISTDELFTSNKTSIKLRRAAVKVAVTSALVAVNGSVVDGLGNGKLTNIVWNIANQNKQMTVFPKFVAPTSDDLADFIASNVNSPFTRLDAVGPATALPLKDMAAAVDYCLENAHGAGPYLENNTTAVQVSATFAPDAGKYISDIVGTVDNPTCIISPVEMTAGTTFYVSKVAIGTQAAGTLFSRAGVDGAITLNLVAKTDFVEYSNGKCFWAIWLNDGAPKPSYGVLRNHMYTMNITGIKAPGFAEFPETDKPISTNAFIQIDFSVKEWTDSNMGGVEV